ncbi:MAG: hypothetical protein HY784_19395, partial [Chloroflexi bacterium]|nr:hypothetical protein [Chloroflexota bacterium]
MADSGAPGRQETLPARWQRGALALILAAHVALGVLYSGTIPMWEAYDEWGHYAFARYLVSHWRLPREGEGIVQANDEGRQPPLYYLLAGLASAPVAAPEDFFPQRNLPLNDNPAGGVNFAVHPPGEGFPYKGVSLALHLMRWVSVLLGTLGVWATYQAARCWFPGRPALAFGAAGLHAFWPQFLFNGSVVTNDVLASVGGSLFVLALGAWGRQTWVARGPRVHDSRFAIHDSREEPARGAERASRNVPLAGWLGLALAALTLLLSKPTTYGLLLLGAGIALVWAAQQALARYRTHRRQVRRLPRAPRRRLAAGVAGLALAAGATAAGMAALWPRLSSLALVAHSMAVITLFVRRLWEGGIAWELAAESLRYGLISFWASFGWGNLPAPGWTYTAAAGMALMFLMGLVRALARSRAPAGRPLAVKVGLLLACVAALVAAPFLYTLYLNSPYFFPGRYFLSALTPLALLLALGLGAWWPERLWGRALPRNWRYWGLGASLALLAGLGASFPFTVIAPAYRPPP